MGPKHHRIVLLSVVILCWLVLSGIMIASEAHAAHTFDTTNFFEGTASPLEASYTCGSGATLLVVGIVAHGATARTGGAPTYNSVAMTQVGETRSSGQEAVVEMWYLPSPPTGSAYTISVPNSGSLTLHVIASSYKAQSGYTSTLDVTNYATGSSTNPSPAFDSYRKTDMNIHNDNSQ